MDDYDQWKLVSFIAFVSLVPVTSNSVSVSNNVCNPGTGIVTEELGEFSVRYGSLKEGEQSTTLCAWTLKTNSDDYCFNLIIFPNNCEGSFVQIQSEDGTILYNSTFPLGYISESLVVSSKIQMEEDIPLIHRSRNKPKTNNKDLKICGHDEIFVKYFYTPNEECTNQKRMLFRCKAVQLARYRHRRALVSTQEPTGSTPGGGGGQNDASDSGPSVAVIAVGVLVPLITIAVIICLVYVWYRRRYPVRMVFGKEFAVFSNPSYSKRSSTLTLVRDPNDVSFEKDIENGVKLTGVYYNRGLDMSDEPQYQPTAGHSSLIRSMSDDTKSFDESPDLSKRKTNPDLSPSGLSLVVDKRNVSKNSLAPSVSTENETEHRDFSRPDKAEMVYASAENETKWQDEKTNDEKRKGDIKGSNEEVIDHSKVKEGDDDKHTSKVDTIENEEDRREISSEKDVESDTNSKKESESSASRQGDGDSDASSDQTSTGEYVIARDDDVIIENVPGLEDVGPCDSVDEDEEGKIEVTIDDVAPTLVERSRSGSLTTEDGDLGSKRDEDDSESESSDLSDVEDKSAENMQQVYQDGVSSDTNQKDESFEIIQSGQESFDSTENTHSIYQNGFSSGDATEESFEVIQPYREKIESTSETSETEKVNEDSMERLNQESKDAPAFTEYEMSSKLTDEQVNSLESTGRESPLSDKSNESVSLDFQEIKISPRPTRYSPPPKLPFISQKIPSLTTSQLSTHPPQSSVPLQQPLMTAISQSTTPSSQPLINENIFSKESYLLTTASTAKPISVVQPPISKPTTLPPLPSSPPPLPSSPPPMSSSPPPLRIEPLQTPPNMSYSLSDQQSPPSTPPHLPGSVPPLPSSPPPMFDDLPPVPKSPLPVSYSSDDDTGIVGTAEVTYHLQSDQDVFLDINSPDVRSDQNLPFRGPFDPISSPGEELTKFSIGETRSPSSLGSSFSVISNESKGGSSFRLDSLPSPRRISVDSGSSYDIVDHDTEAVKYRFDTKTWDPSSSSDEESTSAVKAGSQSQERRKSVTLDNPAYSSGNYNIRLQFSADKGDQFGRRKSITLDNPAFDTNKEEVSMTSTHEKDLEIFHTIEASHIKEDDNENEAESPVVPQRKIVKVDFQMESSDDDNFDADDASVHSGVPSDISVDSDVSNNSDANTTHAYIINEDD